MWSALTAATQTACATLLPDACPEQFTGLPNPADSQTRLTKLKLRQRAVRYAGTRLVQGTLCLTWRTWVPRRLSGRNLDETWIPRILISSGRSMKSLPLSHSTPRLKAL